MMQKIATPSSSGCQSQPILQLSGHVLRYGGIELKARPGEDFVFYGTYVVGQYDDLDLHEGDIVLDAGANVGDFTVQASKRVGASGLVVAVEPDHDLIPYIEHNLSRNHCHNVKVVQCDLGNPGRGRLVRKPDGGTVANRVSRDGSGPEVAVRSITEVLSEVDVDGLNELKMDIEAGEFDALRDFRELSEVRTVAIELHGRENQRGVQQLLVPSFSRWYFTSRQLWLNICSHIARHPVDFMLAELRSDLVATKGAIGSLWGRGSPCPALSLDECSIVYGSNRSKKRGGKRASSYTGSEDGNGVSKCREGHFPKVESVRVRRNQFTKCWSR
jgi:FkbM family methyltransferase